MNDMLYISNTISDLKNRLSNAINYRLTIISLNLF